MSAKHRKRTNKKSEDSPRRAPGQAGDRPAGPPSGGPVTRSGGRRGWPLAVIASLVVIAAAVWFFVAGPGRGGRLPDGASFNILLLTLDTTRADHLGCYGLASAKTPALDGLARDGVRFSRAYCPAPLTLPSHASILSGLYPASHGVRNNGRELPSTVKTLAEILKGHDYATAAFVSSFSVDSRFGIGRGFDVYDDTFQVGSPLKGVNAERRAEETFARFSRWLDNNATSRFFAWVHYYDPHLPYDPPSPYREEFAGRLYDGEIAYMDRYVGAVLDRLREKGLLDSTIVVVAGDHGEGLGDKVERGHGIFLYEETLRVPLIVFAPKLLPRPRTVDAEVRLIDVAPTVLELAGLDRESAGMQGRSLVPALQGRALGDRDSLVETFYPRENFGWSELVGLVSGTWKYIQAPRPELYDLAADPGEAANRYGASPDKAAELRKKLEAELLAMAPGAAKPGAAPRPEDMERLRALGYVNFAPAKPGAAAAADPKDKTGLLELLQQAQGAEFSGSFAEAEAAYRRILDEIPDSAEGYVNLALAQALQKNFDGAVETLSRGIARLPDSETLMVRLGHTYAVMGKPVLALSTMEKVLTLNPYNVDALTVGAGILDAAGRKEEARTYYERALTVEPESRHLRANYAANLASAGKFREAIAVYDKLIADFPEEQALYQFAGIAHSYLGEYDQAADLLRRAVAIKPTPVGYFNLAVVYEKGGKLREAADSFRLFIENSGAENAANVAKARAELERIEKKLASPSR